MVSHAPLILPNTCLRPSKAFLNDSIRSCLPPSSVTPSIRPNTSSVNSPVDPEASSKALRVSGPTIPSATRP